jgi:integrase
MLCNRSVAEPQEGSLTTCTRALAGGGRLQHPLTVIGRDVVLMPDGAIPAGHDLTPHSLRVSFAVLLFCGGASIRTINKLMLHDRLDTTARYTPVPLDDLHRTCLRAHPMA